MRRPGGPPAPESASTVPAAPSGTISWPDGQPTNTVIELVRGLEITIGRRVDGSLHGNYQGITPGHGCDALVVAV